MAVDKMVDSTALDSALSSVADAIRAKGGTSAQLTFPAGFVSAIGAIPTGGGGGGAETVVDATFTGAGSYIWSLNAGTRFPKKNFLMYWYADTGDTLPYGGVTNNMIGGAVVALPNVSELKQSQTFSERIRYAMGNSVQWTVTKNDGVTTVQTTMTARGNYTLAGAELGFNNSGAGTLYSVTTTFPYIDAYDDHFQIEYNRGNQSYKYLNGVTYHVKVLYFGDGSASDFLSLKT